MSLELKINTDFQMLIPPLTDDEFSQLEANILADGEVIVPLITWHGFIVDGHNRYSIAQKHPEIKYSVREMDFEDEYAVRVWICDNQLGRRNLTETQKKVLIGRRYEAERMKHGAQERFNGVKNPSLQHEGYETTRQRIAAEIGVSPRTVTNAAAFTKGLDAAEKVVPGITREIMSGAITVTQNEVISIAQAAPEERRKLTEELRLPQKERKDLRRQRKLLRDIRALAADMKKEKTPPTTKDLLELVVMDINTAIGTFESNLTKCGDAFTDISLKAQLDEIIELLENYTRKLRAAQHYE